MQLLEHLPLAARAGSPRRGAGTARSRRAAAPASVTSLMMIASASRFSSVSSFFGQLRAGVDDDRDVVDCRSSSCMRSISSKPLMSGRPRSSTMQSKRLLRERRQRLLAGRRPPSISTSPLPISSTIALRCVVVVLDDQQRLDRPLDEALDRRERVVERLLRRPASAGARTRRAAGRAALLLVAEMMCTGMWRVRGSCLRRSSTVQPSMSGSAMSSVIASGW